MLSNIFSPTSCRGQKCWCAAQSLRGQEGRIEGGLPPRHRGGRAGLPRKCWGQPEPQPQEAVGADPALHQQPGARTGPATSIRPEPRAHPLTKQYIKQSTD